MLKDLLKEDNLALKINASHWEEAVRIGGRLLVEDGKIEERYIDAMVETVKELGPYIVIAPGIAMPHSRPEEGARDIGLALLSLKRGVPFGNEEYDPVDIVIILSAIDSSSHVQLLAELMELIEDESFLRLMRSSENKLEVLDYINSK